MEGKECYVFSWGRPWTISHQWTTIGGSLVASRLGAKENTHQANELGWLIDLDVTLVKKSGRQRGTRASGKRRESVTPREARTL